MGLKHTALLCSQFCIYNFHQLNPPQLKLVNLQKQICQESPLQSPVFAELLSCSSTHYSNQKDRLEQQ